MFYCLPGLAEGMKARKQIKSATLTFSAAVQGFLWWHLFQHRFATFCFCDFPGNDGMAPRLIFKCRCSQTFLHFHFLLEDIKGTRIKSYQEETDVLVGGRRLWRGERGSSGVPLHDWCFPICFRANLCNIAEGYKCTFAVSLHFNTEIWGAAISFGISFKYPTLSFRQDTLHTNKGHQKKRVALHFGKITWCVPAALTSHVSTSVT